MVLGFGRKGPVGLGCYGKLPRHGDYVSHQSDGAEARWLTGWLDEGYRMTGGDDDPEAPETWFLVRHGRKGALFGALWPSADSSGTRRFPFAVFGDVSGRQLAALGALFPLGLGPSWWAVSRAYPELGSAETTEALRQALEFVKVRPPSDEKELEPAFRIGAREVAVGEQAVRSLYDVVRLGAALGPGKKGQAPSFAIRLPLATDAGPELEASFWLAALAGRLDAEALPSTCHLFLRRRTEGRPGEVFVFHRELRPEDLGFVLSPDEDYDYGNYLGSGGDEEEMESFTEEVDRKAGKEPNLRDLLNVVEPVGG